MLTRNCSRSDYWDSIRSYAEEIREEAKDRCQDECGEECDRGMDCDTFRAVCSDLAHEKVDGSEWIIYYANHLSVIQHTENEEAYAALGVLKGSWNDITTQVAFWAMLADLEQTIAEMDDA